MFGHAELVDCSFMRPLGSPIGIFSICDDPVAGAEDLIREIYYWRVGCDTLGLYGDDLAILDVVAPPNRFASESADPQQMPGIGPDR
uniref:Uncharacterized protein n=1 Tax=Rhodopseudomonas palustris (strain DX-1) TaxID=652103 RepID=E6VPA0_RHOPX